MYFKLIIFILNEENIIVFLKDVDLVVLSVLLLGKKVFKIIKKVYYKEMKKGVVIVDIVID